MSSTIKVKIDFLHDARPYITADAIANIFVSFPEGALPNTGDMLDWLESTVRALHFYGGVKLL